MAVGNVPLMSYFPTISWVEISLALTLLLTYVYYTWSSTYTYWKKRKVPYLKPKFPFGNASDIFLMKNNFRDSWLNLYNQLGNVPFGGIYSLNTPVLVIKDPGLIKLILTKDFSYFTDHGLFPNIDHEPLLHNIFNMEGENWRRTRMKLSPIFTSGKMKMMFPILNECARELKLSFRNIYQTEGTFEAKDLMARFTCDAIVNCVFGLQAASVNDGSCEMYLTGKQMFARKFYRTVSNIMLTDAPKLYSLFKMHFVDYDACENLAKMIKHNIEFREKNNVNRQDFIDLIIRIKNNLSIDDKDILSTINNNGDLKKPLELDDPNKTDEAIFNDLLSQIIGFFLAGYETSSSALAFCLYELASNPDIQIKLQKELDSVHKRHGEMTYQMVQELCYMENVLSETLRRYSTLANLNRICVKTYRIPESDVVIEKGCKVIIPSYAIHHDPKYYPDPFKFDPDRFLEENIKTRPPYTFLSFGEGPRICIGMRFAKMEMKLALATLFTDFNVKLNPKTPVPLTISCGEFLTTTRDNVLLDLIDRKEFATCK